MTLARNLAAAVLCAAGLSLTSAKGAAAPKPAAKSEVKLAYGPTDVRLGNDVLRVVRAFVGNGTASSFDTFTVYLLPQKEGEPWMQLTTPADKGIGYNFRNVESGDATIGATAFYTEDGRLYAVQARKLGAAVDARGSRKTPFSFEVFKYNGSGDVPMFDSESTTRSKGTYVDADEALKQEFFRR